VLSFTAVLNVFINKNGTVLASWWIFTITDVGLISGAKIILRLSYLIMGSSLLTFTTTPVDLTHGIESLMRPLKVLHFPVREFALIMSLTLSLIPSLIEETDRIIRAQKARGADFDTGGLIKRARAFVPILIPLLISSFRRADELALAMDSRCFEGATHPTKMRILRVTWRDYVGAIITLVIMAALITLWAMRGTLVGIAWLYF
jgi:energy-coupling factor transport system permease protein